MVEDESQTYHWMLSPTPVAHAFDAYTSRSIISNILCNYGGLYLFFL